MSENYLFSLACLINLKTSFTSFIISFEFEN